MAVSVAGKPFRHSRRSTGVASHTLLQATGVNQRRATTVRIMSPSMVRSSSGSSVSRWSRMWGSMDRRDRRSLAGMAGFIVLLHLVGFGVLITLVAPRHYDLGDTGIFGIGVG